jgi:hypothetical protein
VRAIPKCTPRFPPQKKISVQRKGTSQRVPVRAEGDAHAAHTTLAITAAPSIG